MRVYRGAFQQDQLMDPSAGYRWEHFKVNTTQSDGMPLKTALKKTGWGL